MSHIEKEKLIKADIASIENRVRHAFNQGYDLGYKEGKANCSKNSTGSTTKNDLGVDLISRADVNRLICEYRDDATETGSERDLERAYGANAVGELISELPSVTPQEPKTGKWISTETKGVRYAFWCRYKCSLCGELSDHTNFCPNCGAKMESEDKE